MVRTVPVEAGHWNRSGKAVLRLDGRFFGGLLQVVKHRIFSFTLALAASTFGNSHISRAEQSIDDLSKAAANPLSLMISLPIQNDFDFKGGARKNGFSYNFEAQPVIPFNINNDWNIITRTLIPFSYNNYVPDVNTSGLGDITTSLFLSPAQPGASGIIWGFGPIFLLPTATNHSLGGGKWGAGPTGVALIQNGAWTVGALANHVWSVAGHKNRSDISESLLEPFVSYDFGNGTSLNLSAEASFDWKEREWTVPVNLTASKIVKIGDQAVSLEAGGKVYAAAPEGGPKWGIRTSVTFFFPE